MSVSQYYGFTNSSNMTLIGRDGNTEPDKRPDNATGDGHVTAKHHNRTRGWGKDPPT
jgi:hypothetical protein